MNEIIKDNRHRIDTACQRCFLALGRHKKAADAFHQERQQVEQSPYIQEEKERLTNKAAETYAAKAETEYNTIHESLEAAMEAAGEMEQLLDVGDEFQNTLSVVEKLGRYIPAEQRAALAAPFKGQMRALSLLRAAYEGAGIDTEPYFQGLIFSTSARVEKLDDLARRALMQSDGNLIGVMQFAVELEKFADNMGVELTKRFHDLVDTSEALTDALRAAAGAGAVD